MRIDTKGFFKTVGTCVTLMITFAFFMFRLFLLQGDELMAMAAFGILPLAEVDLFTLSSYVIIMNPIFGTVCMAVLVPFSISCLYYATSFAPVCCSRPWLAYIVVAVVIAFPRVCNGLTYWLPMEELILYLVQLPMHLLACWSYQKTDTVWAPIAVHALTNLVTSRLILLFLA